MFELKPLSPDAVPRALATRARPVRGQEVLEEGHVDRHDEDHGRHEPRQHDALVGEAAGEDDHERQLAQRVDRVLHRHPARLPHGDEDYFFKMDGPNEFVGQQKPAFDA